MDCKFCKNTFLNKNTLNAHMKTAKYCLTLQKIKPNENICKSCGKSFVKKFNFERHLQLCKKLQYDEKFSEELHKLKEENNRLNMIKTMQEKQLENCEKKIVEMEDKYEKHIKELQDKLENIALKAISKPTTVNNSRVNQIINNLTPITTEHLAEHVQYLTMDHIKDGASGYAKYALEYPLKDKIICVDYSRRKVKYKDEEGNLVDDPEMTKLAKKFFSAIETYNNNLVSNYNDEILEKILNVGGSNNEMTQEEANKCIELGNALLADMLRIKNMKTDIEDIKKGNKPDLLHDFVKDVCLKTTC